MADAPAPAVHARASTPEPASVAVGFAAVVGMGALAAADGGYFPTSWGWTGLVAFWLVAAGLLLGRASIDSGRLGALFFGSLAALVGWTWLSLLWTENTVETTLEGFRVLAYAGAAAALLLVVRRRTAPALLRGTLAAITLVSGFGLATRLFPDRLGSFDPIAGYRLSEPVGYWNGLGIFAAVGALLALGVVARDPTLLARCLAAASFTILLATIYFTFSRGAWIALGLGFLAAFALDPRRLHLVISLAVVGIPAAFAVWACSSSDALTTRDAPLSAAVEQGQVVALLVALLVVAAAGGAVGLAAAERRVTPSRSVRRAFAVALAALGAIALATVLVRFGGPVDLVDRAYDAFRKPPPAAEGTRDLRERLFTFTGGYRAEVWEEAWNDFQEHPLLGSGPGTYEEYWNLNRPIPHIVRDAHSLYLEMLAELGIVGGLLVLLAVGVPIVAAFGARHEPFAIGAVGAYVAYLAHAAIDWDWELTGLTIPVLGCAVALLTLRRSRDAPVALGPPLRIVATVLAVGLAGVAFVGLIGSNAIVASENAAASSPPDLVEAEDQARKARRWAPWSSEPWQRLGEAQLAAGELAAARESFGMAIAEEPTDWLLWFHLAEASSGAERRRALAEATRLNPLSPELAAFRAEQG